MDFVEQYGDNGSPILGLWRSPLWIVLSVPLPFFTDLCLNKSPTLTYSSHSPSFRNSYYNVYSDHSYYGIIRYNTFMDT